MTGENSEHPPTEHLSNSSQPGLDSVSKSKSKTDLPQGPNPLTEFYSPDPSSELSSEKLSDQSPPAASTGPAHQADERPQDSRAIGQGGEPASPADDSAFAPTAYLVPGDSRLPSSLRHEASPTDPPAPAGQSPSAKSPTDLMGASGDDAPPEESVTGLLGYRGDRYELKRELARGGLGRVWLAHDRHIAREVAIKEIITTHQPSAIERFFREAQITGQLEHPGIVPVYDLIQKPGGKPFYAMKLLRGRTLEEEIADYHALPPRDGQRPTRLHRLLMVFVGVCQAIAYAHSRGVLHRDLKPSNVMVGDYGEAILVDWGLAVVLPRLLEPEERQTNTPLVPGSGSGNTASTLDGTVMGTPRYMSPEQAAGLVSDLDERCDIYSLGVILYEILTGQPAITGDTLAEALSNVKEGRIRPPRQLSRQIPAALSAVCVKATSLEPALRYDSAQELAEEIQRWQAGDRVEAYPESLLERTARWVQRHPTLCFSTAVAIVLMVTVTTVWRQREAERQQRLQAQAWTLLLAGQSSFSNDDFATAKIKLASAAELLASEPAYPLLASLRRDVQGLLDRTNQKLADEQKRAEVAKRYGRFLKLRDEALFHGTFFTGLDTRENVEQTTRACREALALFPPKSAESADDQRPDAPLLSTDQQRELELGRRELLIVLAEALAQPMPDESPAQRQTRAREAIALLDEVAKLGPTFHAYHLRRGKYLAQSGQSDLAAEHRRLAEQLPPKTPLDYFTLGEEAYFAEEYAQALTAFDEVLDREPKHFWAQYFLGLSYFKLGRYAEAEACFSGCITRQQEFLWSYLLRGVTNSHQGDHESAESDYAHVLREDPTAYGAFVNRGSARLEQGRFEEAIDDFRAAIALRPQQYQGHLNLAEALRASGDLKAARAEAELAMALSPFLPQPLWVRAKIAAEGGDQDQAAKDYEAALARSRPQSREAAISLGELGQIRNSQGQAAAALQHFRQAIQHHPEMSDLHRLEAETLLQLGRHEEAAHAYDRFLATVAPSPASPSVSPSADKTMENSVATHTNPPPSGTAGPAPSRNLAQAEADARRGRGIAREVAGDVRGAMEDYSRSLALDGKAAYIYQRRGWNYLNHGLELAVADFDQAIAQNPGDPQSHAGKGFALARLGQIEPALAEAKKVLALGGTHPAAAFNAACILAEASRHQTGTEQKKLESQAFSLLSATVARTPKDQRTAFFGSTMAVDPAIRPLLSGPAGEAWLREQQLELPSPSPATPKSPSP